MIQGRTDGKENRQKGATVSTALVMMAREDTWAGKKCILATVSVQVKLGRGDKIITTYAFLDPGSSATFARNS